MKMRSALVWDFTQLKVEFRDNYRSHLQAGTDRFSRNFGTEITLNAKQNPKRTPISICVITFFESIFY